jgi:hypothetical protein
VFCRPHKTRRSAQLQATLFGAASIVIVVSGAIAAAVYASLQDRPVQSTIRNATSPIISVVPRNASVRGIIIYLPDRQDDLPELFRNTIRPLASQGWRVLCVTASQHPTDGAAELDHLLGEFRISGNGPLTLAGHGSGAQTVFLAARDVNRVGGVAYRERPKSGVLSPPADETTPRAQNAVKSAPDHIEPSESARSGTVRQN